MTDEEIALTKTFIKKIRVTPLSVDSAPLVRGYFDSPASLCSKILTFLGNCDKI